MLTKQFPNLFGQNMIPTIIISNVYNNNRKKNPSEHRIDYASPIFLKTMGDAKKS